jgi:hypothetical protein
MSTTIPANRETAVTSVTARASLGSQADLPRDSEARSRQIEGAVR